MKHQLGLISTCAVVVLAMCSPLSGKTVTPQTSLQSLNVSEQTQQQTQQPSQEFQGMIERAGTKYVLEDKASGATYQLDNQDKAKEFLNKDVKVTGTLDPSTNTIEVSEIQETK